MLSSTTHLRDRIEKMRNQMTPQSSQNQEKSLQKPSKITEAEINKIDSEKKDFIKASSKDINKNQQKITFQFLEGSF